MNTKAVLFDLVGTLMYVKGSVGTIYADVAQRHGYKTDSQVLDTVFVRLFNSTEKSTGVGDVEKKWWKVLVEKTFFEAGYDLANDFEEIFEESYVRFSNKSSWDIFTDVYATMSKLKSINTLKLGIISNFDSRLENILKEVDLIKYFDILVYSGKAGYSKPDPRIFQYAINELSLLPEEILYIGDSPEMDYYPAMELNIHALLIDRLEGYGNTANLTKISTLDEIFNYLK